MRGFRHVTIHFGYFSVGKIGIDDFAAYLGLPVSPALTEVFKLYDRNASGGIDFRFGLRRTLFDYEVVSRDYTKLH